MPDSQAAFGSHTTLQSLAGDLGRHGENEALAYFDRRGDHRWSYLALMDHVDQLARGLIEHGIKIGDRLAISARNRPEWMAACMAILRAGAVVVPLDTQLGDEALRHVLRDCGARLLFTTGAEAGRLRDACRDFGVEIILLEDEGSYADAGERSWRSLPSSSTLDRMPTVGEDDEAVLFYTSGTTGSAKGVPLSNRNLMFQIRAIADAAFVRKDDRVLLPLPLHHVYPLVIGTLTPLALGLPLIIPSAFTGSQVLQALQRGRATLIIGVPRLYEALISGLEARLEQRGLLQRSFASGLLRLSVFARRRLRLRLGALLMAPLRRRMAPDLRMVVSGGAALNPDVAWKLEGLGWRVATGYGLTETSPMLTINLPDILRFETAGQVVRGVELRIDKSAAPEGSRVRDLGEVLAYGPGIFRGYLNLPEKTAESFTADGWFRTGDLGWLEDPRFLYLAGRRSTMIVTAGGENVQPDTIEEAYQKHRVIEEIAVLERQGKIVGLIVPKVGAAADGDGETAVRKAVAEISRTLPSYQRLADFAVTTEAIPRTRLGKPRRHLLAERYEQAMRGEGPATPERRGPMALHEMSAEDHALLEDPAARAAWDWLAGRYADRRLTPDSNLNVDLGVDSMEWLNISFEIAQRTGAEITEATIARVGTVRDLLAEVAGGGDAQGLAQSWIDDPETALNEAEKRWLRPLGRAAKALSLALYWINSASVRPLFRLRCSGLENLPAQGPYIIAPNHTSFLDPVALAACLGPGLLRRTYWAGWTGIVFKGPVRRALARLAQAVPIDPRRGAASSLALGAAVLKRNMTLVWFPEGQRSPDGSLQPFRPGLGLLLQHFPVPVVPVVIEGAYAAWPRHRRFPRFSPIAVHIHPQVDPRYMEQQSASDQPSQRIVDALQAHTARLLRATETSTVS